MWFVFELFADSALFLKFLSSIEEKNCVLLYDMTPVEYIFVTHWERVYGIHKLFLKVCDWFWKTEKGL